MIVQYSPFIRDPLIFFILKKSGPFDTSSESRDERQRSEIDKLAKQNSVTAANASIDGEMIIVGHKKRRQVIKRATNGQKPTRPAVRC